VVLIDSGYWSGLIDWMRERLVAEGKLAPDDLDLLTVCDDPAAAGEAVREGARRQGIAIGG
jgi:hypothetical protein